MATIEKETKTTFATINGANNANNYCFWNYFYTLIGTQMQQYASNKTAQLHNNNNSRIVYTRTRRSYTDLRKELLRQLNKFQSMW